MRTPQDITFGIEDQVVYFDAPDGVPASVTSVEVFAWDASDNDTAESALGSPATEVTYPFITLTASAGPSQANPRSVTVGSTTGLEVGRTFRIENTAGLYELFEVESVVSATVFTTRHPLHNDYASGTSLYSPRIQATVDSTWVADETNLRDDAGPNPHYRVRWVYTVLTGESRVSDSYFNLVRYASAHGVRPQDIEAMMPGWLDRLPTDHRASQGRSLIDDAYRAVRIDLHQIDLAASSIAESEVIDELTRYKTVELGEVARYMQGDTEADRVQMATQRYSQRLDSLMRIVSRVPVRDTTGAATPKVAVGLTRR